MVWVSWAAAAGLLVAGVLLVTRRPAPEPDPAAADAHRYRPDIDGLRAVAVLSVVAYHYFPERLGGGFVGVDVFFVLSGFLITGLIAHRAGTGRFTVRDFYVRRIRRIFPALVTVLVASVMVGWFVLFTDEFRELGRQVAAGSFFVANFHFLAESSYFDPGSYSKPLLHLWSLAVEEQFYLVWPLLMVALLRHGRRVTMVVVLVLSVASFAYNLHLAGADPAADYYSPFSRFWQLAAGGMLALWGGRIRGVLAANVASVLGLAVLLLSVVEIDSSVAYPDVWGAAPILGTVLLLAAGPRSLLNRHVLSWRPAVWIGLISYSLYLWHWPMISFANIVEQGMPSTPVRLALIALAIALSYATYRLIETPVRTGRFTVRAPKWLVGAVATIGLVGVVVATPVGPTAAHKADSAAFDAVGTWDHAINQTCESRYPFADKVGGWWFCVTNADRDPDVLLLGDSLANALYPGVVDAYPGRTVLSIGTCAPVQGTALRPVDPQPNNPCFAPGAEKQDAFIDEVLADHPPDIVVIDTSWPRFDEAGAWVDQAGAPAGTIAPRDGAAVGSDRDAFLDGLSRRIAGLEADGASVVLMGPLPAISYDVSLCFARPLNDQVESCTEDRATERERFANFTELADAITAEHPEVTYFDPSDVFCDDQTCSVLRDGTPLFRDQVHLSELGSELVGRALADWATQNAPAVAP